MRFSDLIWIISHNGLSMTAEYGGHRTKLIIFCYQFGDNLVILIGFEPLIFTFKETAF